MKRGLDQKKKEEKWKQSLNDKNIFLVFGKKKSIVPKKNHDNEDKTQDNKNSDPCPMKQRKVKEGTKAPKNVGEKNEP